MQGQPSHPNSPPSDESLASTAGPRSAALPAPISSVSDHAHPRWQAGPINMISSGAPPKQAASHTHAQLSLPIPQSATPTAHATSSTQTRAGSNTLHPHRQDSALPNAAAVAATAALPVQPANGKYGSRAATQVRPQKRRRQGPAQAPAKEPASAAAAAAAAASSAPHAQEAMTAAFERVDALNHALQDRVSGISPLPHL